MKKLKNIVVIPLLLAVLLTVGCIKDPGVDLSQATSSKTENSTVVNQSTETTDYNGLPRYIPGTIKPMSESFWESFFPFPHERRFIYYTIPNCYRDLLTNEQWAEWDTLPNRYPIDVWNETGKLIDEMVLVTLIKHFHISKAAFEQATKEGVDTAIQLEKDLFHEYSELPNVDILYSFDNEIVNQYYRAE